MLEIGVHGGLASGEQATVNLSVDLPKVEANPTVTFTVDPRDGIDELLEDNNEVVDWIKGLTLGFIFSPIAYESLTISNLPGGRIQSPEH